MDRKNDGLEERNEGQNTDDRPRGRRMFFSREDDLDMLGMVVSENRFTNPDKWKKIAEVLQQRRRKRFTPKNVRERVNHLINSFRVKDNKRQWASGTKEGYDELDQRLQKAMELKEEADKQPPKKRTKMLVNQGKSEREKAAITVTNQNSAEIVDKEEKLDEDDVSFPPHEVWEPITILEAPQTIINNEQPPAALSNSASQLHPSTSATSRNPAPHGPCLPTIGALETSEPARPSSAPAAHTSTRLSSTAPALETPLLTSSKQLPKSSLVQQVWAKLKHEQDYKNELVAVERLKAENEKKRLHDEETKTKYKFDVDCRRIKLEEDRMNVIKEHMERTARFQEKMLEIMECLIKRNQ